MSILSFFCHRRSLPVVAFFVAATVGAFLLKPASAHYSGLSAQVTSNSCGNGICDSGESGYACDPYPGIPNGCEGHVYCPDDCRPPENACREQAGKFETVVKNHQSCTVDSDCMLFERSCPFLTCGIAINKTGEADVAFVADALLKCKSDNGIRSPCASCLYLNVRCTAGKCVTNDGPVCGNRICERGEADFTDPGGCGPDADPECLGPPARYIPGTCNSDCAEQTAQVCIDNEDGGKNFEKRGITYIDGRRDAAKTDRCKDGSERVLIEFFCREGAVADMVFECPYGCREGRCIPQQQTSSQAIDRCAVMDCIYGCKEGRCLPAPNCEPIRCDNGTTHPRCSADGSPINYFTDPCSIPGTQQTCGEHLAGETYKSGDGCNTCTCTERGEICTKMACERTNRCEPITCSTGSTYPSCTEGGDVINYFIHPCRLQEEVNPTCGNNLCENDERVKCPQDCPVQSPDRCLTMLCPANTQCREGRCIEITIKNNCEPKVCNGHEYPTCTDDGTPINYFIDPCRPQELQNSCGNNMCERGERDEYFQLNSCASIDSTGNCVPSEAQKVPGTCPSDCTDKTMQQPSIARPTLFLSTPSQNHFRDTTTDDDVGRAANILKEREIIGGYPDGTFGPEKFVNRAEAAKFLMTAVLTGELPDLSSETSFSDVGVNEWFTKYVALAARFGVINGNPDNTFRPGNTINTAEFLKMLTIAFNLESGQAYLYTDVPADAWFSPYAGTASVYGLFADRGERLEPGRLLTRGEVALAIATILER